jgi:hypothetical protein
MGRWSLVQCDCPNREPLEYSRWGSYACGHEDGAIIAFAPNDLLGYGQDLDRIYKEKPDMFEVWRGIGDWRNYNDEYLCISPDETMMWQLEIEELRRFLSGEEFMGWDELQLWKRMREEERQKYARAGHEPTGVDEVLASGLALCHASRKQGRPVEFFW